MSSTESVPVSNEHLEHEILQLGSHINAAMCRWLLLVGEYDTRKAWEQWEVRSMAHWLGWHCGIGLVAAREHVRIARVLVAMPLITAAFERGELSYSKVRALTRIAKPETEASLIELAKHATASHVERLVRSYRRADPEIDGVNARHENRMATWYWDDDGYLALRAKLSPEDGAMLINALERAKQDVPAPAPEDASTKAFSTPAQQSAADALVRVAERSITSKSETPPASEVVIVVDQESLADDSGDTCHVEGGPRLSPETARRLTCDGAVMGMLFDKTEPADIGRRSRKIPRAMRRALHRRDEGCMFPGCSQMRYLDGHHIVHWSKGGPTSLINLVELCRTHHRAVHENGYSITKSGDGFTFVRPDGEIVSAAPLAPPRAGNLVTWHIEQGNEIEDEACRPNWYGDHPDYGLATEALFAMEVRAVG